MDLGHVQYSQHPVQHGASWAAHPEPLLLPLFPAGKIAGVTAVPPAGPTFAVQDSHAL